MKPIPRHTHSIELEFVNKRNKLLCFRATIPLDNVKHNIASWYKRTKEAVASSENIPVWQIKGSHKIIESVLQDRILFEWAGGMAIDLPADATPYDYQIVLKQLEVLQMKFNNPSRINL